MARRIALIIHSLSGGGAERIAAMMASHWAKQGDEVSLITLDAVENDAYPLADQVHRIGLAVMKSTRNPFSAALSNIRRIRRLRSAIRSCHADHVVSLVDKMNVLTLFACRGLHLDVVICERVHPRQYRIGMIWSFLRRISYPWCRALTVQTAETAEYARRFVDRQRIHIVPNPVYLDIQTENGGRSAKDSGTRTLIAMGRFVEQKGFDMLLDAFARIVGDHPDWQLQILGDGPLRGELERIIAERGLQTQVQLPGWITSPYARLRQSDIYVLSSRYEGFPMVLLEAMACGLPVISFDCESGPRDIVRDDIDGRLVPPNDVSRLAQAMDEFMSDNELRARLAERATDVCERFSQELFFERWEAIFKNHPEH